MSEARQERQIAPRCVSMAEAAGAASELLGGKGASLAALAAAGFDVPPFFVVTTSVFEAVAGAGAREVGSLPAEDAERILAAYDQTFGAGAKVAVRSSAVGEDSARDSFAGQMETFLYVDRGGLLEAVTGCFASALAPRAAAYRRLRGRDAEPVRAAVIVQEMIPGEVSGVTFTVDPTTGDRSTVVVSAGYGLGEGVVADLVETDTFFVDRRTGELRRREVAHKRTRRVSDGAGGRGTRSEEVEPDRADAPVLGAGELARVADLALRAEEHAGGPQDVEWTLGPGGRLYLLQSRPITTVARAPAEPSGRETLFDNSNIVESYPGITLPLSFTFARAAYAATFRSAARMFGVRDQVIEDNGAVFENLIALVEGRIYYNLLSWYRLYEMVGMESALPAFEEALGIEGRGRRGAERSLLGRLRAAPDQARVRAAIVANLFTLDSRSEAYLALLEEVRGHVFSHDLARAEAHTLIELAEYCERTLSGPYGIAVVNDFYTQQLYAVVGRLIERWGLGDPEQLRNDLLSGETGMQSVAPVKSLLGLAERVRADAGLSSLFRGGASDAALWRAIQERPDLGELRAAIAEHFRLYADRTLSELKLETPSLRDDPELLVRMLRNYVGGARDVGAMEARERGRRRSADAAVAAALARHPVRRRLFERVIRLARGAIRNRENLRLARSRGYGVIKRLYREVGARLAAVGALDEPAEVFYLTVEEMKGAVRGHLVARDPRALVEVRRRDYRAFETAEPAPRLVTRGPVIGNRIARREASRAGEAMQGVGCSPGTVTAPARVICDPEGDLSVDGHILVAPMTDPGWVFLMVAASGLVVEKGSVLSHTAIIGRELGVPTVVGVADATRRIRDGDLLEIDGRSGTVRLVT